MTWKQQTMQKRVWVSSVGIHTNVLSSPVVKGFKHRPNDANYSQEILFDSISIFDLPGNEIFQMLFRITHFI